MGSPVFIYLVLFLALFGVAFSYLRFVGLKEHVGYWVRHEPLSVNGSLAIAFLVALFTTVLLAARRYR